MKSELERNGKRVLHTAYADLVKYTCEKFFGWNGKKDNSGRTMLQYVGTDIVRAQNENFWVDTLLSLINFFKDSWDYVIISDARFPNEISRARELFDDVVYIKIFRTNYNSIMSRDQLIHSSENSVDEITPDVAIINEGTLRHLEERCCDFIRDMIHDGR